MVIDMPSPHPSDIFLIELGLCPENMDEKLKERLQKQFGERFRNLRKKARLTQEQAAERADVHVTYISDIERGVTSVGVPFLFPLADALGVHVSDFFPNPEGQYRRISELEVWLRQHPEISLLDALSRLSKP